MLTLRNVASIAHGEWGEYFSWKLSPKLNYLLLLSVTLLVVFFILFAIVGLSEQYRNTVTQVVVSDTESIQVETKHIGGFVAAYQKDIQLPTMQVDVSPVLSNGIREFVSGLASLLLIFALGCILAYYWFYNDMRERFVSNCMQRWIDSGFKDIPDRQVVIDFINKEK